MGRKLLLGTWLLCCLSWSCKSTRSQLREEALAGANGFVQVREGRLVLNGEDFRFFGSNFYRLALADAFGADVQQELSNGKVVYPQIDKALEHYASLGVKVVRLWGFSCEGSRGSRVSPAILNKDFTLNDKALRQMDFTLAAAARYGIKIIYPFVNFEHEYCGMEWWVENTFAAASEIERGRLTYSCLDKKSHQVDRVVRKAEECPATTEAVASKELFYTDPLVKKRFQTYVQELLIRPNIYTGVALRDDPTVMALELANEPHTSDLYECLISDLGKMTKDSCRALGQEAYQKFSPGALVNTWLAQTAAFVKTIDRKHLLSSGEEAYRKSHDDPSCLDRHTWIHDGSKGVDFAMNAKIEGIDLISTHLYPDNWAIPATELDWFDRCVIQDRARLAKAGGKVIFLEESGFSEEAYAGKPDDYRRDRAHFISRMFTYANRAGYQGTMVWQAAPLTVGDKVAEDDSFTFPILTRESGQDVYTPEGHAVRVQIACQKLLAAGKPASACTAICPAGTSIDGERMGRWPDGTSCYLPFEYPSCPSGAPLDKGWGWIKDKSICDRYPKVQEQFASKGGCSCKGL